MVLYDLHRGSSAHFTTYWSNVTLPDSSTANVLYSPEICSRLCVIKKNFLRGKHWTQLRLPLMSDLTLIKASFIYSIPARSGWQTLSLLQCCFSHDIQLLHFQQWQNMTQSSLNENSSRTQKLMLYSFWLLLWLQRKKSLCSLELIFLPNHDHRLSCLPFFYVSLHAPYFQITNHMHVLSMTLQQVWHF